MNAGPTVLMFTVHRFRWVFAVTIGYMAILAVLGQLPATAMPPWVAGLLVVPYLGVLITTIFSFVNIEADFCSTASAYPAYLLRLPIRTSVLVLWPTIAAILWSFGAWVALCAFYFHPRGVSMPMIWPAAMFAALVLCLQGILWVPVRFGNLRLTLALFLPLCVVLFGMLASYDWSERKIAFVYFCICVVSLGFAWFAVDRARTSPPGRPSRSLDGESIGLTVSKRKVKSAFRSPEQAQFWLEWRRQGRILPIATAVVLGLFSIPIFFNRGLVEENAFNQTFWVNVYVWPMLPVLPWIPLLMATAIGMGARRSDMRGNDGVYHLYFATRPLDEESIYRARIRSITASVLVTIPLSFAFLMLWLWQPAVWNGKLLPFWAVLTQIVSPEEWRYFAIVTLVIGAWMWRNQVVGAFVDYITSRFLSLMYPLTVCLVGAGWLLGSSLNSQFIQSDNGRIMVSTVLTSVLIAKLAIANWFGGQLVRRTPTAKRILAWSLTQWTVVGAASASALCWIARWIDGGNHSPYFFRMPIPILIGLIIVPLARPTIARWALQTGRHC